MHDFIIFSLILILISLLIVSVIYSIRIYDTNTEKLNSIDTNTGNINQELSNIDNQFILNVSSESVSNHSVRNIFGQNSAQPNSFRAVWELSDTNDYIFPTLGLNMTVTSNGVDDGVIIRILGLNSDYEEIGENITLNNVIPPVTTNQFFRINDVIVTSGNASQNIVIENGGVTYAQIDSGKGRNQASIFTVPANNSFYLYRIDGFTADNTTQKAAKFRNKTTLSDGRTLRVAEVEFFNQMNIQRRLPFKYSEKTDIVFEMSTFSGSHPCSVFGEGILVKNN
jgi:hypothetical protein